MIAKVILSVGLFLLSLLVIATVDIFFDSRSDVPQSASKIFEPEQQLLAINEMHPLEKLFKQAKKSPKKTHEMLKQWRENHAEPQFIELVYSLWIERLVTESGLEKEIINNQLQTLAHSHQAHWLKAWELHLKAKESLRAGSAVLASQSMNAALAIAEQYQLDALLVYFYNTAGIIANEQNELIQSQQYFLKGIKLTGNNNKHQIRVSYHNNLGLLYIHLEQWHNALEYLTRAEQIYQNSEHKSHAYLMLLLFNQSFVYNRLNDITQSRHKFEQGMHYFDDSFSDYYKVLRFKAQARLGLLEGNHSVAMNAAKNCLAIKGIKKIKVQHGVCLYTLSRALYADNQLELAYEELLKAVAIFDSADHQRWLIRSDKLRAQIQEKRGKPQASLNYYKQYYERERSMFVNDLRALDGAMELQKIAQERDLLSAQNHIVQLESKFDKQRVVVLWLWLWVIGMMMLWLAWHLFKTRKDNQKLYDLSFKDPLTGAGNRRLYKQELAQPQLLSEQQHYRLVIIDLDKFKCVNDHYGHDKGDIVLKETAARVMAGIDEDELFFRWGGEEFLLILKDQRDFRAYIDTLRHAIKDTPFTLAEQSLTVTASFGVSDAVTVNQLRSTSDTFRKADECLYKAKNNGRDCVVVFDDINTPA